MVMMADALPRYILENSALDLPPQELAWHALASQSHVASTLIGQMKGGERVANTGTRGAVRSHATPLPIERRLGPLDSPPPSLETQGCVSTFVARARLAGTLIGQTGRGEGIANAGARGAVARALARQPAPNRTMSRTSRLATGTAESEPRSAAKS